MHSDSQYHSPVVPGLTNKAGVWTWDLVTQEQWWSQSLYHVIGFKPDELPAGPRNFISIVHPEDIPKLKVEVDDLRETGRILNVTYRIYDRNKRLRIMYANAEVERYDNGVPAFIIGTVYDITNEHEQEKELKQQHTRYRLAVDNSISGLIEAKYNHGKVTDVFWSKRFYELLGYGPDEVREKLHFTELIHPDDLTELAPKMERITKKDSKYSEEVRLKTRSGSYKWFLAIAQSTIDESTGQVTVIGIFTDINYLKEIEKALTREKEKAQRLLDVAETFFVVINEDIEVVLCNKKLCDMVGLPEKQLLGKNWINFVHPEDQGMLVKRLNRVFENKLDITRYTESHLINKEGNRRLIAWHNSKINYNDKTMILSSGIDITEQRLAEEKVKQSELKFKAVFQQSHQYMVLLDAEGRILDANETSYALTGGTPAESVGEYIWDRPVFRIRNTANLIREMCLKALKGETPGKIIEVRAGKGEIVKLDVFVKPVVNERGDVIFLIAEGRNISELLAAKETALNNAERLKIQNRQLQEFAHIASHNIRGPVSNSISLLELYKQSENEDEKNYCIEKLEAVSHKLLASIDDLSSIIKTNDTKTFTSREIDLSQVLYDTTSLFSELIAQTQAEIRSDFSHCERINYPPVIIESVFQNLISNSIKYRNILTPPKIVVTSAISDGRCCLTFSDNGSGIDLEKYGDKIFGLYNTFHKNDDAKGVGLYLIKTQIESLGGKVELKSKPNEGTVFTITL